MQGLSIAQAVEVAYCAFAREPLPGIIAHAPTENRREAIDDVRSAPLRHLTAEKLSHFAFCAMTTIGDEATYRRFLPRILELAADGAWDVGLEPELIAGKLVYGDWRSWSLDQQDSVAAVFEAAARTALIVPSIDDTRIESWLAGLARLALPTEHLLDQWRASRSRGAVLQLATFANDWAGDRREQVPPYWDEVPHPHRQQVRDWLISRATMAQLVDGLGAIAEEDRWLLSGAIDRIRFRLNRPPAPALPIRRQ